MSSAIDILINATDQASDVLKGVGSSVKDMEGAMQKAEGASLALLGAVSGAAIGVLALGGNAVRQLAEIERISAQTDAVIKSTGGVANVTAQELADMAVAMQYKTSVDHESIRSGANLLLTFTNIRNEVGKGNDIFNRTTGIMTDLSVAMGTDTKGAATMLGKALNDPMEGLTALSRVGVSFTNEQKEQVKALQESGDMLGAQKVILEELEVQYGGSAEALGNTLIGQMTIAKMAFDDIGQAIMDQLGALDWLKEGLGKVTTAFLDLGKSITENGIKETLQNLFPENTHATIAMIAGAITVGLIPALYGMGKALLLSVASIAPFLLAGAALGALAYLIYDNWSYFEPFFTKAFETVKGVAENFKVSFMAAFQTLMDNVTPIWESLKTLFVSLEPVLLLIGTTLGIFLTIALSVFNGVIAGIGPLINAFVNLVDMVVNVVVSIAKLLTGDFKGATDSWNRATQNAIEFFKSLWEAVKNFFVGFVSTFLGILKGFGVDLVSSFKNMMSNGKKAVSEGVANIVSTIVGFGSTFLDAGKGLLSSFTDGIKNGIKGAIGAVSDGMKAIRNFLPFSPAKKGPLSDLDKSGESFFPTWYEGALKGVGSMERAISGAMDSLNDELEGDYGAVALDGFSGGSIRQTVTIRVEGKVAVEGDTAKDQVEFITQETKNQLAGADFLNGLRQAIRKN